MTEAAGTPPATLPAFVPWTMNLVRPHRRAVVVLSLLLFLQVVLGALQPWTLSIVIDYVLNSAEYPLPPSVQPFVDALTGGSPYMFLAIVVVGGLVLQVINQFVTAYAVQHQVDTGQRMVFTVRARLFGHLQALGMHHHVSTSTGDAVYRIDADAYSIENLVMSGLIPLATSIVSLVVMFAILARLDTTVALLALTIVPFLFLCLRYYMRTLVAQNERVKELESKLVERLFEVFYAIRLVKSFAREAYEARRFGRFSDEVMRSRIGLTWQESLFGAAVGTITLLGTALVVGVGGAKVLNGTMSLGQLTVVIAYLNAVYGPLSEIAHTSGRLQGAIAGARRVRAMLAVQPEVADAPGAVDASHIKGEIRYEGVGFAYPDGTRVLSDISFDATPGQMIALVGLTGAGKTTLVSLLPRFYRVTEGRILVDGRPVDEYALRSLRERIAIVLQDPVLFAGSIADNLRYGRLDATDSEVEAAARAAHAHDFIMRLPRQYQTSIAEAGGGLSGGERQRLSVARAVLKNAPILILDEPTSSLDAISEEIVFAALRHLRAGRTTIVIAHRLSTVKDADRILVLDGGRLVAQGRHDELLASSLLYRRMCARLSVGKSLDEPESVDELIQASKH